jgi:hypothetical protein
MALSSQEHVGEPCEPTEMTATTPLASRLNDVVTFHRQEDPMRIRTAGVVVAALATGGCRRLWQ